MQVAPSIRSLHHKVMMGSNMCSSMSQNAMISHHGLAPLACVSDSQNTSQLVTRHRHVRLRTKYAALLASSEHPCAGALATLLPAVLHPQWSQRLEGACGRTTLGHRDGSHVCWYLLLPHCCAFHPFSPNLHSSEAHHKIAACAVSKDGSCAPTHQGPSFYFVSL